MNDLCVSFIWQSPAAANSFRTGVSLHGHTMHSEECLSFLPRYLHRVPGISQIVSHYQGSREPAVDFARAYWTPPLSPASALQLEREQIEGLGLRPLVSLTDHDKIEAGISLGVSASPEEVPISVEWTMPYRRSIFHLGIHNLPRNSARSWMTAMEECTAAEDEGRLREILRAYHAIGGVLVVLNHPFWLEEGMEDAHHRRALSDLLRDCGDWFHALELNGTRLWNENAEVIELARAIALPVISGGDRHACEPAACLNLTDARSFSEFAAEVREGISSVVFMPQYRQPMGLRLLEAVCEILRPYPEYPGRERWIDRVFYRAENGNAASLAEIWGDREHWIVRPASTVLQLLATSRARVALRTLTGGQTEMVP